MSARVMISAVTVANAAACTGHASHGMPPTGQWEATTHADTPSMAANDRAVTSHRTADIAER